MSRKKSRQLDAVSVALFGELFASVAEEMGGALQRASFSPNVKERRDYSCAIFTGDGVMVAQAAHIPVHLGSSSLSVRAVLDEVDLSPGDEIVLNDPFRGGTHLPDITVVRPLFFSGGECPDFLVVNRAHHADMGGPHPGSMGISRDVFGEGFRIPPVHLRRDGRVVDDFLKLFRAQVRQADEREGDLRAQMAANHVGECRLRELVEEQGIDTVLEGALFLPAATTRAMRGFIRSIDDGAYSFEDYLDDDGVGSGRVAIRVTITIQRDRATVDFSRSDPQVPGPMNANLAITRSAVGYVFRALLGGDVPTNDGILAPVEIIAREGCVVNAVFPAAVAAGNVETSQRIVDVLFGALSEAVPDRVPAASAGTMSNLSLGGDGFTYYETIGGGSGASATSSGASAIQTHMTNTWNTPIEMLESTYPLRVSSYAIRRGSGGEGARRGGDGIERELIALAPMSASVLADRQGDGPYGLDRGEPGSPGETSLSRGSHRAVRVAAKVSLDLDRDDRLRLRTPGGGGHGRPVKQVRTERRRR